MNYKIPVAIFSLTVISFSCSTENTRDPAYSSHIDSLAKEITIGTFCDSINSQNIVIELDRIQVRRYNLSTYQVGVELRRLMFVTDSLSYDEILDTNLVCRNNKGKMVNIPFKKLIVPH